MKTLVLCVDYDDDFGEKGGVASPIVGRRDNVRAALKLGLADPEDADTNGLFGALNMYDRMKAEGRDVEIATLCGHMKGGRKADGLIARQLDDILTSIAPDRAILVSDGAGDESILPILQSRIKVDGVRRIIVKQHENIESTFYILKRWLEDPRQSARMLIPVSLVLLVYGLFLIGGMADIGVSAIFIVLGIYILMRVLRVPERAADFFDEMRRAMASARFSPYTMIIGFSVGCIGLYWSYLTTMSTQWSTIGEAVFIFLIDVLWWFITALLINGAGRAADRYFRSGKASPEYMNILFSAFALGFVVTGVLQVALYLLTTNVRAPGEVVFSNITNLIYIVAGVTIGIIGAITSGYVKHRLPHE